MAPIKFEEQIKEKMEERHLSPSAESWSKLSSRLDEETAPKLNKFWWLAVAASLVLIITFSYSYFNNDNNINTNQLVEEEATVPTLQPNLEKVDEVKDKIKDEVNLKKPEVIANENELVDNVDNSKKQSTTSKSKTSLEPIVKQTAIVQTIEEPKKLIEDKEVITSPIQVIDKDLIDSKVAEVIKNTQATEVTDREVDSLLKVASKELVKDKILSEGTTVDADALLESVQDDMGQSFRTRVFEALKDSYETVKTAVAERNN